MNEVEELKDKIRNFLNKKEIEPESQYFLLLSITDDLKDEIIDYEDEEDLEEEDEMDEFVDFVEEPAEDPEPEEPEPTPAPKKSKTPHSVGIKKLLKKKAVKKPKIKIKKDEDDLE